MFKRIGEKTSRKETTAITCGIAELDNEIGRLKIGDVWLVASPIESAAKDFVRDIAIKAACRDFTAACFVDDMERDTFIERMMGGVYQVTSALNALPLYTMNATSKIQKALAEAAKIEGLRLLALNLIKDAPDAVKLKTYAKNNNLTVLLSTDRQEVWDAAAPEADAAIILKQSPTWGYINAVIPNGNEVLAEIPLRYSQKYRNFNSPTESLARYL